MKLECFPWLLWLDRLEFQFVAMFPALEDFWEPSSALSISQPMLSADFWPLNHPIGINKCLVEKEAVNLGLS